jgi:hypothetical protein
MRTAPSPSPLIISWPMREWRQLGVTVEAGSYIVITDTDGMVLFDSRVGRAIEKTKVGKPAKSAHHRTGILKDVRSKNATNKMSAS